MNLLIVGINYKTAPLEIREKLAFSAERLPTALLALKNIPLIEEAIILSTCNRVEVYVVTTESFAGIAELKKFFSEFHQVPLQEIDSHFYHHFQEEAVLHGFRVAGGLDSMVLGEPQILGQVKDAYRIACEANTVSSYLHRYFHHVFRIAKKIRTDTQISTLPVSISYAAVLLAEKIFGDLKNHKALLVGTGKMGKLALTHLKSHDISDIWISNRNFQEAQDLAIEFSGHPVHFDDFTLSLPQVDIVIASTAADKYILNRAAVESAMQLRKNKPMFIIDISVPRNVDPEINRIYNVYLYDIDDLRTVIESNQNERQNEAKKAETIIIQETKLFLEEMKNRFATPTLHLLAKKLNQIRLNEINKTFGQLKDLTDEEKIAFEACTEAMIKKILHDPSIVLKTENEILETDKEFSYAEIIQKLFRLDKIA